MIIIDQARSDGKMRSKSMGEEEGNEGVKISKKGRVEKPVQIQNAARPRLFQN
jgi:hypothetical protein